MKLLTALAVAASLAITPAMADSFYGDQSWTTSPGVPAPSGYSIQGMPGGIPVPVTGTFSSGSGRVVYTPAFGTATAYAGTPINGIVIGGLQTLTAAVAVVNGAGTLNRLNITSLSGKTPNLVVYVYESAPTGCGADNTVFTLPSTDNAKLIGYPFLLNPNLVPGLAAGPSAARYQGPAMTVVNHDGSSNLYACVVTTSTFTGVANDFVLNAGLDRYQ